MYLQKLVIQGFKSFANKTALDFKPGVTAIVGPNGSGKSNIADAVRWVLGEQSLKTLRGKKSGDVIFAGSDKKTRLGYCQVDLHLNNDDHKAPVDFSEIVISRKVFRDGEGEYYINKTRVRLQDVLMLLAKSNFGQRSYSIIGQGMVDMFLSVSPSVRKEYFDEAAGVRQFQIKKEQAESKLRLTKENLGQAELLIQEIDPRLRSLTRQVNRLQRREVVTKELKEIQHKYYAGFWHDLKSKHQAEEQNCQQIETKQKTATSELESIQKKMQQLAVGSSRQDEFQKLQREYDQINIEKNTLLREQAELKGQIDADRQQKGATDIVWLERKKEQLENELKNLDSLIHDLKQEVDKYSAQLESKEKEQAIILNQHQDIYQKLTQAKEKLANKKSVALPEVAKDLEVIYDHQKNLLEKIEKAQTPEDLRPIKAEAQTVTSSLAQLNHKLKESGEGDPHEIIALQDKISILLKSKGELNDAINDIKIKLQVAQEKENISQKNKSQLSEELNKINRELNNASSDKSVQQLEQDLQQEKSKLDEKIKQAEQQLKGINDKLSSFNLEEQKKKEEVFALQNTFSNKQDELNKISSQVNSVKIELAKLETRQEDLEKEMVDELSDEERNSVYKTDKPPTAEPSLFTEIQKLKRQLELIGGIDPQVSQEYKETKERYNFLTNQSEDLNKAIIDLEKAIANLNETIKKQFNKAFDEINKQFTQYFKILFSGGNASLSLVKEEIKEEDDEDEDENDDETDEENEDKEAKKEQIKKATATNKSVEKVVTGIDIHATPPGKKLKGISMLSGGERALTSIALICAIIHHNPSPFVILDEVDAALDESNSIRFASIIDRLSKKTQFILVTHNRATMDQAHTLYGVTMGDDGVSKLLSVNMEEAEKVIDGNN